MSSGHETDNPIQPGRVMRLWQHRLFMSSVTHYENFPVASWLCPARLRPAVVALYWYARTADDLADEGPASAHQRLQALALYRQDCLSMWNGTEPSTAWAGVFQALAPVVREFELPLAPLLALLDAFEQDVRHTANGHRYHDEAELLDYCSRSANPVGRLLLHLYGVNDTQALQRSDAICTALQLINFWQDLSVDLPRGRHYLPQSAVQRHGLETVALQEIGRGHAQDGAARRLMAEQVAWARNLLLDGAPLADTLPGRLGWELRGVVLGGLAIVQQIEAMDYRSWRERPRLRPRHAPGLLWQALRWPQALQKLHTSPVLNHLSS